MAGVTTSTIDSKSLSVASDPVKNDIFISYSRKDKTFVERLDTAFRSLDRDPWIDWDDIRKGEEWWEAIKRGIEAADTFIFVISPDSIASSVCREEVDHAANHNKRFLPIVWREGFDAKQVHPAIGRHNWLFFRETDSFDQAFQELLKAMETDLPYVRFHTRLLVRAIEWQNKGQNQSYLLRGSDLQESEQWLIQGISKEPQPTELQSAYINTSRNAEADYLKARQKARWVVVLTTVLVNMLLAIGGGYWFYVFATTQTMQRVQENLVRSLDVGLIGINGDDFQALASQQLPEGIEPTNNPLYQEHQDWLRRVQTVFPRATLRSYVRGDVVNEIEWIGDVSRISNTNPTRFRQSYNAEHLEIEIYNEAIERTVINDPYVDDSGRWVSAAGPIKNSIGETVGGLKVYFREDYVLQVQNRVRNTLAVVYILIFVWLFSLSLFILRVTRPREL